MARIRTIKPEFFTSEQVVECSTSARLLFVGMWCFCDDAGIHPASVKRLKMEVFPGDALADEAVKALIDELISNGLLAEFQVGNERFWHVTGWKKHQKIDKPSFKYPTPDKANSTSIRRTVDEDSKPQTGISDDGTFLRGQSPAFKKFWQAYPRRIGQHDALKAYDAAVVEVESSRGLTETKAQEFLLEAAEAYASSPAGQDAAPDDDFRPSPANWLKSGRYTDEPKEWLKPNGSSRRATGPPKPKSAHELLMAERNGKGESSA